MLEKYEVNYGHRRLLAAKQLHHKLVTGEVAIKRGLVIE